VAGAEFARVGADWAWAAAAKLNRLAAKKVVRHNMANLLEL
jgi:hypothetical protein